VVRREQQSGPTERYKGCTNMSHHSDYTPEHNEKEWHGCRSDKLRASIYDAH